MARRLALITGASAGIGAASARIWADHGYDLAITARRGERLEALAQEISLRFGTEAIPIVADLADPAAPAAILDQIAAHGRVVDALINNAGYGLSGTFTQSDWPDQRDSLQVMLTAPTELMHRVLPGMVERRFGRIVNVASLAGLAPGSVGQTLYAGIKSYLIKVSQSLHLENLSTGVHVTALCPGFTWSEFHDVNGAREMLNASVPRFLWLGADEVAASGYEAAEANRPVCVTGAPNKAIAAFAKVVPDDWALALMAGQGSRFRKV